MIVSSLQRLQHFQDLNPYHLLGLGALGNFSKVPELKKSVKYASTNKFTKLTNLVLISRSTLANLSVLNWTTVFKLSQTMSLVIELNFMRFLNGLGSKNDFSVSGSAPFSNFPFTANGERYSIK
ncbi:hypothetical protein WICPIJ_001623 [Wickerhamomyces pijperi]|uniref:Uncharacterized protein n=1 Tax=Wickerhamomyces pijperi TaxID=599730 RepID=A0A9P8QAG5_WICPI|nr:hypothetical protein WICPIJ_001623 [Wickerhamomyces pijperi]